MTQQLTMEFEAGIAERHATLAECLTAAVYHRGLSNVAADLGKSPGNLSRELAADDDTRHFSIDSLERYMSKTGDLTPIYYLCDKFLGDQADVSGAALSALQDRLSDMTMVIAQLAEAQGVKVKAKARR